MDSQKQERHDQRVWDHLERETTPPAITMFEASRIDVAALEADLRQAIKGEVRFDNGSRALYATDSSNYRFLPIGVVVPRDKDDVKAAVAVCRKHGAPITNRGCGTSLAGQTCNVAVIMDFSKSMHGVLEINAQEHYARVLPGTILDTLRNAAEKQTLTFGPDPATHNHCTLGGMMGNDSCGMHAQMAGRTSQNTDALEMLLYDGSVIEVKNHYEPEEIQQIIDAGGRKGEIFAKLRALRDKYADTIRERFPIGLPRLVSGYALQFLLPEKGFNVAGALIGSEGTLGTILEAKLRLIYSPPVRLLVVLGYPSVYDAGDHVPDILPFKPTALEGLDDLLVDYMKKKHLHTDYLHLLPEGKGWLMVELGGESQQEVEQKADELVAALRKKPDAPHAKIVRDKDQVAHLWKVRESGLGATAFVPGEKDSWPGWEDSAVPPDKVGAYLRDLRALFQKHGYNPSLYGHFGQGCIHCRVQFDLTSAAGIENYRNFVIEAAELVTRYGGSLSGEHGDGQSRGELLPIMFGDTIMQAFREFKAIFDPDGKMNPGKLIDAYPLDQDLRLGTDYHPPEVETHFRFPADNGHFSHAALRCVGVGNCRRLGAEGAQHGEDVMCPSFMVTREEKHSTRGRARLLFEMMNGKELGGWKDEHVHDALHLCLACKGCKHDCPVNVDMATYKAEFLSHYYEGKLRPRTAYAMGLIMYWAKLASYVPRLANLTTQLPGLSAIAKAAAGIAQERHMPAFAEETFMDWWRRRTPRNPNGPRLVYWVDTFNNFFHPEIARAGAEVLETAGYHLIVPQGLCCGRPLYDYGFLDLARNFLQTILVRLQSEINAGVPVVGLEPSCVAVFRDELTGLMPEDPLAARLQKQTFLLGEFLLKEAKHFEPPTFRRKAKLHMHCHHKAVLDPESEVTLLKRMGVDVEVLNDGCCGMAGSFGFEAGERYDVAVKAGERVLLPAVREADPDTLVITNGFSCHEQIVQGTDRRPLHLAEVLRMALVDAGALPQATPRLKPGLKPLEIALLAGAGVAAGAIAWRARSRA